MTWLDDPMCTCLSQDNETAWRVIHSCYTQSPLVLHSIPTQSPLNSHSIFTRWFHIDATTNIQSTFTHVSLMFHSCFTRGVPLDWSHFSVVYCVNQWCYFWLFQMRGPKVVVRFLPHEVADLEPTLALLSKQDEDDHVVCIGPDKNMIFLGKTRALKS